MPLYKELSSIASSQPRLPLVFLVDTSGSMRAASKKNPIEQVNCFLEKIPTVLLDYQYDFIDLAIVEFDSTAKVVREFSPITDFSGIRLEADGVTAMGEAICLAYEMLRTRRRYYKECGLTYYRPIVLMLTDGEATDDISQAKEIISANSNKSLFWMAGIEGSNQKQLSELTNNSLFVDINSIGLEEFLRWFFLMAITYVTAVHVAESPIVDRYHHLLPAGVFPIQNLIPQDLKLDDMPGNPPQLPPMPWDDWLE